MPITNSIENFSHHMYGELARRSPVFSTLTPVRAGHNNTWRRSQERPIEHKVDHQTWGDVGERGAGSKKKRWQICAGHKCEEGRATSKYWHHYPEQGQVSQVQAKNCSLLTWTLAFACLCCFAWAGASGLLEGNSGVACASQRSGSSEPSAVRSFCWLFSCFVAI